MGDLRENWQRHLYNIAFCIAHKLFRFTEGLQLYTVVSLSAALFEVAVVFFFSLSPGSRGCAQTGFFFSLTGDGARIDKLVCFVRVTKICSRS